MYIQNAIYKSIPVGSLSLPVAAGTIVTINGNLATSADNTFGIVPETITSFPPTGRIRVAVAGQIDLDQCPELASKVEWLSKDFNLVPAEESSGGGGGSMLKVNLTYQSSYTGNYKYDIDHTFDEIHAAIEAGQVVVAISASGEVYQLLSVTDNIIKFFRAEYVAPSGGAAGYVNVGRVNINKSQYTNRAMVVSANVNTDS